MLGNNKTILSHEGTALHDLKCKAYEKNKTKTHTHSKKKKKKKKINNIRLKIEELLNVGHVTFLRNANLILAAILKQNIDFFVF